MESVITVLYVPVCGMPTVIRVANELEHFQALVEGYTETDRIAPGVVAIVNEDGIALELPRNRNIHGRTCFGNVLFVHATDDDFTSITPEDMQIIQDKLLVRPIQEDDDVRQGN